MKLKFDTILIGMGEKLNGKKEILDREYTEEEIGQAFGHTLKLLREYEDLSLKALSKEIDIPFQTINRYENGVNIPTITQAIKIADYFHMSIELFVIFGLTSIHEHIDVLPYYQKLKSAIVMKNATK